MSSQQNQISDMKHMIGDLLKKQSGESKGKEVETKLIGAGSTIRSEM